MTKRIIAIVFIFICTSVAWAILGGTIFSRTYDSGLASTDKVASTWGSEHTQIAAECFLHHTGAKERRDARKREEGSEERD